MRHFDGPAESGPALLATLYRFRVTTAASENLLGEPLAQNGGQDTKDVWKDPAFSEMIQVAQDASTAVERELRIAHPLKRDTILRAKSTCVRNHHGKRLGVVTSIINISVDSEIEALRRDLFSMAAPELRTTLVSVLGFSERLLMRDFEPAQQKRYLSLIAKQSKNLRRIIDDVLDIDKLPA